MKLTKKIVALLLVLCFVMGLAACGAQENEPEEPKTDAPTVNEPAPDESESATEENESAPEEVETPADQKPVILAVSFGTSYNETRDITIGAIEEALQAAYPEYEVRRAFTAQTVIDILEEREGLEIDNVTEAMSRLVMDGVKSEAKRS